MKRRVEDGDAAERQLDRRTQQDGCGMSEYAILLGTGAIGELGGVTCQR